MKIIFFVISFLVFFVLCALGLNLVLRSINCLDYTRGLIMGIFSSIYSMLSILLLINLKS